MTYKPDPVARAQHCRRQLDICNSEINSYQQRFSHTGDERYRTRRDEAMADAEYWRNELQKARSLR